MSVLEHLKITIDGSLMGMTSYIYNTLSETQPYKDEPLHDREITPEEEAKILKTINFFRISCWKPGKKY